MVILLENCENNLFCINVKGKNYDYNKRKVEDKIKNLVNLNDFRDYSEWNKW